MTDTDIPITGGCLCGAVRYEAVGAPLYSGHCYCSDCRKASGSGFIPFIGFSAAQLRVAGETLRFSSRAFSGGEAVRNFCPTCASLVFGGVLGVDAEHTVYAGSLDDPSRFTPQVAIFNRDRPAWVPLPEGLAVFDAMPTGERPERPDRA